MSELVNPAVAAQDISSEADMGDMLLPQQPNHTDRASEVSSNLQMTNKIEKSLRSATQRFNRPYNPNTSQFKFNHDIQNQENPALQYSISYHNKKITLSPKSIQK